MLMWFTLALWDMLMRLTTSVAFISLATAGLLGRKFWIRGRRLGWRIWRLLLARRGFYSRLLGTAGVRRGVLMPRWMGRVVGFSVAR